MTAFHAEGPTSGLVSGAARATRRTTPTRLQQWRAERLARREFDAVFRAWTRGTPLPASARRRDR